MNNQNPYNQQPQQGYQQPNYQAPLPPMPQAPQPPQAPQTPFTPKTPFFNNDMLGMIGCAASILGFGMSIFVVGATNMPIYALILNILAILFSAGGCFLSFVVGNQRIRSGAPRGTVATLGLIFGVVGVLLCLMAIFVTGCATCNYCKASSAEKAARAALGL
ncbi:MAG: hypothetical protein VZR73_07110 [Acutalibacteraceae bacterium]|nr:hypothetical protein [Acutalibacteraceae bacterium]